MSDLSFPRRLSKANTTKFEQMGWTDADWDDLDDPTTWDEPIQSRHQVVRQWLRHPTNRFQALLRPDVVRDTFTRYGPFLGPGVLNAVMAGATWQFVNLAIAHGDLAMGDVEAGWVVCSRKLQMRDVVASAWAATGMLNIPKGPLTQRSAREQTILERVRPWTKDLRGKGHLYVLAGFDLPEATALNTSADAPTYEALMVMATLNGAEVFETRQLGPRYPCPKESAWVLL